MTIRGWVIGRTYINPYKGVRELTFSRFSVNLGRGRKIPTRQQRRHEFNVHRSVKLRLDAGENVPGGRYTPKAQWEVEPNWVD